jgi:hypothetical protein
LGKLTLEEAQKLAGDVGAGLGGVCNDVFDAIEGGPPGPGLAALIERGRLKVRQYDDALTRLSGSHARQLQTDYERKVARLKANLLKLESKQRG